jgi:hypothetical protein
VAATGSRLRAGAWGLVLLVAAMGCTGQAQPDPAGPRPAISTPAPEVGSPDAALFPAAAERDRPGDRLWAHVAGSDQHSIEGFTSRDSARPGEPVRLAVSTRFRWFRVEAYRMGWYAGARARRVWVSGRLAGRLQPAARVDLPRHTPVAQWQFSLDLDTRGWLPGDYLLRLDAGGPDRRRFVPLTLRSPSVRDAVVLINATTTWQAYNDWGGYSLYHGPSGGTLDRARAVSFDRPYAFGAGAGDFLGNELPLLSFAERLGLRLAYLTDVDLHSDPSALDGARAVISPGHDEYWSPAIRRTVTAARDRGVNLAFLGANAVYRKIRFEPGPRGPNRIEVSYKNDTDPIRDPHQVTTQWRAPPSNDPESSLVGTLYQCNVVKADMVAADDTSWLNRGIVHTGQKLPAMVGSEYDRVDLSAPTPRPIQVLFHSPLVCEGKADHSDTAYYTTSSGAGVFSSGTNVWVCALQNACADGYAGPLATPVVQAVTTRLLTEFAAGPAGRRHPARDNATRYYPDRHH